MTRKRGGVTINFCVKSWAAVRFFLASDLQCSVSMENVMKKSKHDLLEGFVLMPHDLMQSGWPLKIDLYRYTPMKNVLELCWKQGEIIELGSFLELSQNPTVLLLAQEESVSRLRSEPFTLDYDPGVDQAA